MSSPVQARNERSKGIEKSSLLPNDVTRGSHEHLMHNKIFPFNDGVSLIDTIFMCYYKRCHYLMISMWVFIRRKQVTALQLCP